jgi:hypothetical protein
MRTCSGCWAGWGGYLNEISDLSRATPILERTLADTERVLGADHPDTLGSRNNLAYAYESAGRTGEAIPLHEQTPADSEWVLDAGHPHTLGSRNNLEHARAMAIPSRSRRRSSLERA